MQHIFHFPPAWDDVGIWCTHSPLFQNWLPAWHSPECCIISVITKMLCIEPSNALEKTAFGGWHLVWAVHARF